MAFLDTLLVNGHDLRAMDGIRIVGYMELFAPGDRRGDDSIVPGARGELGSQLPLAKYIFHVPIQVMGNTRGERNDNLRVLGSIVSGTGGLVTLTRRIATGSGSGYVEHTAPGRFITGLTPTLLNHVTGRTELQFYNLKGAWFNGSFWTIP